MKPLFSIFLFISLLLLASCDKGPAIHPALKLVKGDHYFVDLDVNMVDQTRLITPNISDGKQRFNISYEWEVLDIVSDTEYIIRSTITNFDSRLRRGKNYDDGIVIGNAHDSTAPISKKIPLDSVLKKIISSSFDFRITRSGEVTEVHGADSAIYSAFANAYGINNDSIFKSDYFLIKSFCGNSAFSNFVEPFFSAFPGKDGWHSGYGFSNTSTLHEQLETFDQDYEFYSLNSWKCNGKDSTGNYELVLKGDFANQKNREQNNVGFDLKVSGTQTGTLRYDTLSFFPTDAAVDQNYELASGMRNVFFSFKLTSYKVQRSLHLKIRKKK
jgi:hypothetical protein